MCAEASARFGIQRSTTYTTTTPHIPAIASNLKTSTPDDGIPLQDKNRGPYIDVESLTALT